MTAEPGTSALEPAAAIRTRADFVAAVHWAMRHAIALNARRMVWLDPAFVDWPLDEPALLDALTAWLRLPGRSLTLVAGDFEALRLTHPRFVAWRRDWAHVVEGRRPADEQRSELPSWFVDDTEVAVQLIDRRHWRGRTLLDGRQAHLMREQIDAILQRSEPDFPATQLGL